MLEALRNATKSWLFRGFLIILASTFALFFGSGGSLFSGLANKPLAIVGGFEISQQQFADAYVRRYDDLKGQLSPEQARQLGLPMDVLSELITGSLIDNVVDKLGITVPDATLAMAIRDQVGDVNTTVYQDILRQQGFSVDIFENLVRRDLARNQLIGAIVSSTKSPDILNNTIFNYRDETRIASIISIPFVSVDAIEPTLPTLTNYHKENIEKYTAPEFRELVFISLTPSDVMESILVTDDEIKNEYELRINSYTTQERRELSQLFFTNLNDAEAAIKRIQNQIPFHLAAPGTPQLPSIEEMIATLESLPGAVLEGPLAAAAQISRRKNAEERINEINQNLIDEKKLGWLERNDLPEGVAESVFSTEIGVITTPLKSSFGWHIYLIENLEAGEIKLIEEARDEIHDDLAREKAMVQLYDISINMEDSFAAGNNIEEVAAQMGLKVGRVTINDKGLNLKNDPSESIPKFVKFIPTAFTTNELNLSRLIDTAEGGYFILRVDNIILPRETTYFEVAEKILDDWKKEEQSIKTLELAETLSNLWKEVVLSNGLELVRFDDIASEYGYQLIKTNPFYRILRDETFPGTSQLASLLFSSQPGESVIAPGKNGGFDVAITTDIIKPEIINEDDQLKNISNEFSQSIARDLLGQYTSALEILYGVNINNDAFERALEIATQSLPITANR